MATISIVLLKSSGTRDGKTPVYLRFMQRGKANYISLKHRVSPEIFNPNNSNGRFIDSNKPNASKLNYLLTEELNRAKRILIEMEFDKVNIDFQNFRSRYRPLDGESFVDLATQKVNELVKSKEISAGSKRVYNFALKKFKKLFKDISLGDLNQEVFEKFQKVVTKEASESTANTYLRSLHRLYYGIIEDENLKDAKPFKKVSMGSVMPERKKDHLTEEEEAAIFRLYDQRFRQNLHLEGFSKLRYHCLRNYCFMLRTGLRISDLNDLKFKHLVKRRIGDNEVWFIEKQRVKGRNIKKLKNKMLVIPLLGDTIEMIDFSRQTSPDDAVFFPVNMRSFNTMLNFIAQSAGIKKHLTSHTARHTISERLKERGVTDDNIARILGNTKEVTRDYYAHGTPLAMFNILSTDNDEMRMPTKFHKVTLLRTEALRENMVALRKKRGLNPVDVCDLIGQEVITLSQYNRYEKGQTLMSIYFVYDFCRVFGVTLADLEKGSF